MTDISDTVVDTYLKNINDSSYEEYLDNFKKTLEDRKKCLKSKKCIFTFEITPQNIIKKKDDKVVYNVKLPKYILVEERLLEIDSKLKAISEDIKYMQNIINLDSDKKLIEKYKNHRKEFMELEKEQEDLYSYLFKVNKVEEKEKLKIELTQKIREIKNHRIELYLEIQKLHHYKNDKKFKADAYEKIIKEYIDTKELLEYQKKLKELNEYSLKTDDLFFNIKRDEYVGKINYIVKELPNIKKESQIKKKSIVKKKSIIKKKSIVKKKSITKK